MDEADAVSEYVNSLSSTDEGRMIAALALGCVAGTFSKMIKDQVPIRIAKVDIPTDEDDNYRDYIIVTTYSGIQFKVQITEYP